MEKGKLIFWGLTSAVVAGGSYLIYKKLKNADPSGKGGSSSEDVLDKAEKGSGLDSANIGSGETSTKSLIPSTGYPLQTGSVGKGVVLLQIWLKYKGSKIEVDGKFGNETLVALKPYFPLRCFAGQSLYCKITQKELDKLVSVDIKTKAYLDFMRKHKPIYNRFS
jgi:hypothetical protein